MLGVNLNSPYEAAKRLSRESDSLLSTGQRLLQYLEKMEQLADEADRHIVENYESEYQKVESVAQILVQMITEYKEKVQARLTDSMVKERNTLTEHKKDIQVKKQEVNIIKEGIT